MDERLMQLRVGIVVVVASIITGALVLFFGGGKQLFTKQYAVTVRFPTAPGVNIGTPVRKNGVVVGRVTTVENVGGKVDISMEIVEKQKLQRGEICQINTLSLLGDAVLDWVGPESALTGEQAKFLADGEWLDTGVVSANPLQILTRLEEKTQGMADAFRSVAGAGSQIETLAENLNRTVTDNSEQFARIIDKSELALDSFNSAMGGIDDLLGDPEVREGLRKTVRDLPKLFEETRLTLSQTRDTLDSFQRVSEHAETNLKNLEGLTGPLGEKGAAITDSLDSSLANLDELLAQLVEFSRAINSREGSLGQFVHDPEIYQRLNRAANNIEIASRRIRPIMDDVRIFTDKIARDPRQLGVKGALDRRPSGYGVKNTVLGRE